MIGRKASVGGFLSPPSNPRAQPWTGGGNYRAGVRLQLTCMKPESLVIAIQPYSSESVPGPCTHPPSHMGAGHARSRYLNRKGGMSKAGLVTGVKS
ncbi:hypothetical protein ACH5RR_012746 [Cinchona calisaya]|uniref:Uncharacterized protein n=1 Tax=Cinchona calisaya TaxID=153742 RepID=A0ABD3AC98_9GENT